MMTTLVCSLSKQAAGVGMQDDPAVEPHTIRFSHDLWAAAEIAAKHRDESVAEYIRTAVLARTAYDLGRRDDEVSRAFDHLWHEASEAGKDVGEVYDLDDE